MPRTARGAPGGMVFHVWRWRLNRQSIGEGHLYQGTYKSFPARDDDYFDTVGRYVERNALRPNLVERAEDWRWGSLWQRRQCTLPEDYPPLSDWPLPRPRSSTALVNRAETEAELEALRISVSRGRPFGSESWQKPIGKRLGLESTFRPRGRPKENEQVVTLRACCEPAWFAGQDRLQ